MREVPLALLFLLASCGVSIFTSGVAEAGCAQDADCGSNAYCEIPLSYCGDSVGAVAAGPGVCHRSCSANACVCTADADCPGSTCSQGTCGDIPFKIPVNPCTDSCTQTYLAEVPGSVCLCQSCPGADGGDVDAGVSDAGDGDAGPADAGDDGGITCPPPDQFYDGYCSRPCDSVAVCTCADGTEAGALCPVSLPMACGVLCADHGGWCPSFFDGGACSFDGGPADGGVADGGASDAGGVTCGDAGTCIADQLCFAATSGCGGAVNSCVTTYTCASAGTCSQSETCDCFRGTEDPCGGAQQCQIDGSSVACWFDYP